MIYPTEFCLGENCYVIRDQVQTVQAAEGYCQAKGGHLASVQSQEENDLIQEITNRYYPDESVMLGRHEPDQDDDAVSAWFDGTPVVYTNWAPMEPSYTRIFTGYQSIRGQQYPSYNNEKTLEMMPDGQWNDFYSDTNYGQLRRPACQIPMDVVQQNAPYN